MKIPRQSMPERDPKERSSNFDEVALGLTPELAILEASRCLQCPKPTCIQGCPVGIKINEFIALLAQGEFCGAASKIKEDNILPAICGRVCPQEEQCEAMCVVGKKNEPVAIGHLERFVADYQRLHEPLSCPSLKPKTGKRIAIVGSGPAGLSCAFDLIQQGHDVTVFEALHEPGGVLLYGIPEFRLPKDIVRGEIEILRKMGVEFRMNAVIGYIDTIQDLFTEGFQAIFIGVGAGLPHFLNIPGENLVGVYSANEFLTRVNLMQAYRFPEADTPVIDCRQKQVIVFGGGNTAMDSVRTAKRLGAEKASICYRRSEVEMPARYEEVKHARAEGIEFLTLLQPLEFKGTQEGLLKSVQLIQMVLAEPDKSGRRIPIPMKGTEQEIPVDVAIIAVGNGSNPVLKKTTPGLTFNGKGQIAADPTTLQTSIPGVFAGGDIVTGGATVILAMGAGRKAATSIDSYLNAGLQIS